MRDMMRGKYKRSLKLIVESILNDRNKLTVRNTLAVAIFGFGAGNFELKSLFRTTREKMTMYAAFHFNSDVNRQYQKKHEEGRGLISIELWC